MINIPALSKGKLLEVYNETITTPVIVQILNLKPLPGKDRYRCEVSDGISKINAIFASQFNTEISSGTISSNSVLSLNKYTPTPSKTSKILVIVQATVVHPPLPEVIGNPIFIEASSTPSPPMNQPNMIPRPPNPYPPQNVNQPRPTFNQPPQMNNTYNRPPQQQPYNQMTVGGAYNQPMPNIPPTHIPIRPDVVSGNFMKIAMLNPYSSTWTIKGRISKKAPIKTYTNSKGPGKLFNIEIIVNYSLTTQDEDGSEIKGTFFNDEVERWFDVLSEGMVYAISGGNLRPAKREFSSVNCYFTPLQEDGNIKSIIYNLVKISDIANIPDGKSVDVLGVVYSNQPSATIPTKKGEMVKKDMELVDSSGYRIRLTLWGEDASNNDNIPDDSIIVAKGCKIGNFNGKSLSLLRDGVMLINPNINEAIELRRWYDGVGKTSTFTSFGMSSGDGTERKRHNLIEITKDKIEETLNSKDVSFIDTKATITKIPHEKDLWYPSCPNMLADTGKQCRKKLTEDLERNWSCERCGQSFPRPDYRYIANFQIKDHTGNVFASCFDDEARIVFHQPAEQLLTARDSPDYEDILFECCFQEYNMTIKSNYNIDQGEKKYRRTVAKIEPIEFVKVYKIE